MAMKFKIDGTVTEIDEIRYFRLPDERSSFWSQVDSNRSSGWRSTTSSATSGLSSAASGLMYIDENGNFISS
jgi:hypothetical protein